MMILVARYTFLFWLFIGNSNAEKILLHQIVAADEEIFRLSSCTAHCLKILYQQLRDTKENAFSEILQQEKAQQDFHQNEQQQHHQQHQQKSNLQTCFDKCHSNHSGIAFSHGNLRKIQENFRFQLICRDDRSLTFRIDIENVHTPETINVAPILDNSKSTTINRKKMKMNESQNQSTADDIVYFIRINNAEDAEHYQVYLSDENFFTIKNLTQNSTYNITVVASHANNDYSVITKMEQFQTLRSGYIPGMVKDVKVLNFNAMNDDQLDNRLLTAEIMWKPSIDMTCHYNIICYSTETVDYDMTPFEIRNPRQLYRYEIENLSFSKEYKVGIRAKNTNNESKESEFYWATFRAPACVEFYNNNFNICAPLEPQGLYVEKTYLNDNEFALNISWQIPQYLPDYYVLKVLDLADNADPYSMNVSKEQNNVYIENITLRGIMYEVHLIAYTPGGKTAALVGDVTHFLVRVPDKHQKVKLISAIFAPIFCLVVLSLTTFIICHRRAKLKRYQERCKYFEELEKKAPIDPKATFDFPTKTLPPLFTSTDDLKQFQLDLEEKIFFNDDAMEIERSDVTLYELLGEGAFGFVRRGVFHNKKSGETTEVAVKMLKEQPSIDDVRAFRREIEVMKSVERHPNIVGIIGHCTKRSNAIMLLTEYCSLGNLLDFLRNEWKYLHEIQSKLILSEAAQKSTINRNKQANSSHRLAAINKSYGYDEICTNACKCQVDIVTNDNSRISNQKICNKTQKSIPNRSSDDNVPQNMTKTIQIKDCECQQRQRQQKLCKNNKRNAIESENNKSHSIDNKAYFNKNQTNENLQSHQEQQQQQQQQQHQKNSITSIDMSIPREPLSASDLLDIAKQVATGMEFLAKNKVVHRDLAARNILVATDRTIKIADFGLSRDIYQENIYKKSGNGKLPIKWLALESMTHQVYTTQSDVWSYGILLYEIATLGGTPYPSIPTNRLLHLLKTGYRMEKPKNCGQEFYNLMASCWHANPGERPTFTEIIKTIDRFMCYDSAEQQIETALMTLSKTRKENNSSNNKKRAHSLTDDAYLKPL